MSNQFTNHFTRDTLSDIYLSPFVSLFFTKSGAWVKNSVSSQKYFIPGQSEEHKQLFNKLNTGLSYQSLLEILQKNMSEADAEAWVTDCMQKGLLE